MLVNSYNQEFGYELLSAVPYAYELYLRDELTGTISAPGSAPLYYFSPNHKISKEPRSFSNTITAREKGLPYTKIHVDERPPLQFPPYKEHFKNDTYKWSKPTLVIANRYNEEWGKPPINFFDVNMLDWLFKNLKKKYEIVYIAVDLPKELEDHNPYMPLNDREVAEKHNIKVFQDIKGECWNTSLLQVFANCDHYITMNGGYSILASLFSGTNIVYSTRWGNEQTKEIKRMSFDRWYPNHNNQRVTWVDSYNMLKSKVENLYIKEIPTANIIVRTSGRPNAFEICMKSIELQDYQNINTIITCDDVQSMVYTRGKRGRLLKTYPKATGEKPEGEDYGRAFPSNVYIKQAQDLIQDGYVFIMDDDNIFNSKNAVTLIMQNVSENELTVWKLDFTQQKKLPSESFGKEIKLYDIDSACFCYHIKHKNLTDWSAWKRADFRTARNLAKHLPIKWLDAVLTALQSAPGGGRRTDLVINPDRYMKTVRVINPIIGKVGCVKRLPKPIAAEMVAKGYAEYLTDTIDRLNKPVALQGKPVVTENKMLNVELENKADDNEPAANSDKRRRAAKPRASKKVPAPKRNAG